VLVQFHPKVFNTFNNYGIHFYLPNISDNGWRMSEVPRRGIWASAVHPLIAEVTLRHKISDYKMYFRMTSG
jgi:hypothetical protein